MNTSPLTTNEEKVKEANRKFYDAVADNYEEVDGRRSPELVAWLKGNLAEIAVKAGNGRLLDIGTGSGFLTRCAEGIFKERVGTDISSKILEANKANFDLGVAADADALPFKDNSFNAVSCFAVLHHLCGFEKMVKEISRVLKPGGIFYTDHDMDKMFHERFCWPLSLYRAIRNAGQKYKKASSQITDELYHLSEWQEEGIDAGALKQLLETNGFTVDQKFHWFGLNSLTDKVFDRKYYSRGWAPLVQTLATRS